jgi:hypothetical protein
MAKKAAPSSVRWNAEDELYFVALMKKTGISSASELARMGLRALAEKLGVNIK